MRSRIFILWAAIRGLLLIFVIVTAVEAPAVVLPMQAERPLSVWGGVSSWYGEKFHGRVTANGEVFDMYAPTVAHRTLPLGSLLRLVNPKTGQSRVVRVNDRGPVIKGREIDVSYDVARSLGFESRGLAKLRIELLEVPKGSNWQGTRTKD